MKKNKKKGFTLVELLAVIVILAVILIIAIPQIMDTIKTTRLKTMEDSAKLIATNAEKDYLSQQAINQNYNAASIPCTDVAKLSDDYSSCRITYNDSGVATVKLKGASGSKFSGITCTGTKDNMDCRQGDPNAPEYVYSAERPETIISVTDEALCKTVIPMFILDEYPTTLSNNICTNSDDIYGDGKKFSASDWFMDNFSAGYTYTVTDQLACKNWLLYDYDSGPNYLPGDTIVPEDDYATTKICGNNSDIWEDGSNVSSSSFFANIIDHEVIIYDEISSFVTQSNNVFDSFVTKTSTVVTNYSELGKNVFIRWPGDATDFDFDDNPEVCILYRGNSDSDINCFEYNNYEYEKQHLADVFGKSNCYGNDADSLVLSKESLFDKMLGVEKVNATSVDKYVMVTNSEYSCHLKSDGYVSCTYSGYGVEISPVYFIRSVRPSAERPK